MTTGTGTFDFSAKKRQLMAALLKGEGVDAPDARRIQPRVPADSYPLSYAQQRLWFLDQLVPNHAFYNCAAALRLPYALVPDALERSLNEIVARHESLRTTFHAVGGQPTQVIADSLRLPLPIIDLRSLSAEEAEWEALRLATEEARRPFDLAAGPLVRTTLIRLADNDYVFLLTMHHIVSDGWSMTVFFEELKVLYGAFFMGRPSPLPPLPVQYADFALWQRQYLDGGPLEQQLAYWTKKLSDLPVLLLPTDRPREAMRNFAGARQYRTIPPDLLQDLKALAQRENVTLFMVLLAGLIAVLNRYTGQHDIVVGGPIANRNHLDVEGLIGFFVNSIVLRTDVSGDPTFLELLRRAKETSIDACAHQDVPFEMLVDALHEERNMWRNPLYQVSLQYFSIAESLKTAPELEVEKGTAAIDIAIDVMESPDGLVFRTEYSTELFDAETIARLIAHLETLLRGAVEDPGRRISRLPLLGDDERRQVLFDWNRTAAELPGAATLHGLFEEQAARTPDAPAVSFQGERLSYAALDARANRLARYLRSRGVGPESVVAVSLERSVDLVVGLLAILKAGGAFVPLDADLPPDRSAFMLRDSGAEIVLTRDVLAAADIAQESGEPLAGSAGTRNLAYVIYTSGSTGRPKGVMVEHRAICNQLLWMQRAFPLSPDDRVPQKYSLSFDVAVLEIFGTLIAGARLVIAEPGRLDPAYLARLIVEEQLTAIDLVPSMLQLLLDEPRFAEASSLRRVTCGGEALSAELRDRLLARFDVELNNMYGPTEATITAAWHTCKAGDPRWVVPIGTPAANTQLYVLDEAMNPVPIGVRGELYIGGDGLARGYLGLPDLTRDRFVPNPFTDRSGDRLYRTGDIVRYRADGALEFHGRLDHQVKLRGIRLEPGEIETALLRHPSVQACAVVPRVEGMRASGLIAYVTPRSDRPELWPSIGEYGLYDELMYHAMTHDELRNRSYQVAIDRLVRGKTVVDVGTGGDAFLACLCAEAGAARVYAIERLDPAFIRAGTLIASRGLADRITLLHGDSMSVELPEKVDVCVSELIGMIGSSEGAPVILADARRYLKDDGVMIPERCVTKIAAARLPDALAEEPAFGELSGRYVPEIFKAVGHPFDVRICVKNFPAANVVSEAAFFEDLDFARGAPAEYSHRVTLRVTKGGRLDGFILWLELFTCRDELIDSLHGQYNWLPVFFPAFYPGIAVSEGDTVDVDCSCVLRDSALYPDYTVSGAVHRSGAHDLPFSYTSSYRQPAFRDNEFYRRLFPDTGEIARPRAAHWGAQQVSRWRDIYDELYKLPPPGTDPQFNTVGWNSTDTGQPLPAADMQEQVDATVARIRALRPRRILEIGCGTGLLLFRLAPECERYVATDVSAEAVAYVRGQLSNLPHVDVRQAAATDFSVIDDGGFDVVVLNSVVQYFPSAAYLQEVLRGAVAAIGPSGHVFVGDVRDLGFWDAFHTSVELSRADAAARRGEIRERVARRRQQEQELVIAREWFEGLPSRIDGVTAVEAQLKRGSAANELTRFRYDVVLAVRGAGVDAPVFDEIEWDSVRSLAALRETLSARRTVPLVVRDVPNARVIGALADAEWVRCGDEGPDTVGAWRAERPHVDPNHVEPESIWHTAEAEGYETHVGAAPGLRAVDVLFRAPGSPAVAAGWQRQDPASLSRRQHTNDPQKSDAALALVPGLRAHLRASLPESIVPESFVFLDSLPLTPSGKVDHRRLPDPDRARPELEYAYVPPATPVEKTMTQIWGDLLPVERVGTRDNFFELGGHSLLAMRVVSRVRDVFRVELPLRDLFEHPTVAGLAAVVEGYRASSRDEEIQPVTAGLDVTDLGGLSDAQVDALLAHALNGRPSE